MRSATTPPLLEFAPEHFRALARKVLRDPQTHSPLASQPSSPLDGPSDLDLNPELVGVLKIPEACPAAVLVPVVARPQLTLLLTQRTDHLPAHAGQIAFPGGKMDEGDADAVATALREAEEEIGLAPHLVEPLGLLEPYRTGTGFCITPVVALVDPAFSLNLNRNEVVDAFEVPLPFLMNPANHQTHVRTMGPHSRRFYAMPYGERFIWGATAGILRNMHERLYGT